jgi:DNA ligase D-like protein (predicted 3'-phosphoesterase)
MASRRLEQYRRKRDLGRSGEPAGGRSRRCRPPAFVIQKHHATSLHYDFRLEVAGVLRSWAVPKGPSTDPRDRRLAMEVEDHPLDYASFEGVIEEGSYGAGPVIVWDTGTYRNVSERDGREIPIEGALRDGHASVWLEGHKLHGAWWLRRIREGAKPQWLLAKWRDAGADARRRPTSTQPESVLSGRTIEELARSAGSGG